MKTKISQLEKEFRNQVFTLSLDSDERPTTSVLTEEELIELQNAWIQLVIWKQSNATT